MPILSFRHYADLPEAERLRRIGGLIAAAVTRFERGHPHPTARPESTGQRNAIARGPELTITDPTEKEIVRYLIRVGGASPRDLCIGLGAARMTVTRKLSRLMAAGWIEVTGKTRAAFYRMRSDFGRN